MAKAKGSRTVSFIVLAALVVCLVLAIVGLSIDQWTTTEEVLGYTEDISFSDYLDKVSEMQDAINKMEEEGMESGEAIEWVDSMLEESGLGTLTEMRAMVAFALITVLLLAVAAVICLLNIIFNIGFFRFIVLAAGVLALVAGIVAIAITAAFCGELLIVGAGAALLAVGGILGGLTAGAGFFLGKKEEAIDRKRHTKKSGPAGPFFLVGL